MNGTDLVVVQLDKARTALIEAKTIQDTKQVLDIAAAAEIYAKRQHLSQQSIDYAHDIKIEALGQLGRMLKDSPKATGGEYGGKPKIDGTRSEPSNPTPTLADLGLDKKTSSIAQRLAALPAEQFDQVKAGTSSIAQAIREVTHAQRGNVVSPEGKYRIIYADPPWQYNDSRAMGGYGGAEDHYPTMSVDELVALDIEEIADDDSALFCWATFPLLPDALVVVNAWGFTYKTALVWHKPRGAFGNYHDASAELLLICTRGSCLPDVSTRIEQVQCVAKTPKHSEKPEHFRALIDSIYTDGQRIELFARAKAEGWEAWGNE